MIKSNMTSRIETIINLSRNAQTEQDWGLIDQKIQSLNNIDPNLAGKFVLNFSDDQDSRVRDTTATILEYLNLTDTNLLDEATKKMITQSATDDDIFASGRAATFLLKHSQHPQLQDIIKPAIKTFTDRAISNNWQQELIENIPNETLHQLFINIL